MRQAGIGWLRMKELSRTRNADPTRQEMLSFLAEQFGTDTEEIDIEAAIHWFAVKWHDGQNSNLYAASCASPYKPGLMERGARDVAAIYCAALQERFS